MTSTLVVMRVSRLQKELRQTRPFPSLAAEATVALMKTADVVRRSFTEEIEHEGITFQQYNVLRILRGAGEAGIPTLEIVERMIEKTPGITRLLDRLEAKRLVRRERCPTDRRQVLCWITSAGLETLARLEEPMNRREKAAMGRLGKRDLEMLLALLETVRDAHQS
jgi:MarR family transcriptional regulator, organic hydroperoxide resistance regulator